MNPIRIILFLTVMASFLYGMTACSFDKLPEPTPAEDCDVDAVTYNGQIEPLLETYCTINSDCHASGSPFGDYSSYGSMIGILNENGFENRTVIQKEDPDIGMPPDYSDGPIDFTDEDFALIECWIAAGYPEN